MKTDFIIHEPSAVYHEQSRTGKYLSSHLLADFRESPALYHKKVTGEIEDKDSSAGRKDLLNMMKWKELHGHGKVSTEQ